MRYLGEQIDIHGGGRDLIFSHHESERAQSESLTGCVPFARVWMHTGMVRFAGRKMSKSLGNLVLVNQALERAPAAAVRLYLASHAYRRDWDFSWSGLARATSLVERLRVLLGQKSRPKSTRAPARAGKSLVLEFRAALADDLDTPRAIRLLRRAVRERDAAAAGWMVGILAGSAALT
jgi:cysteinyl-tRNA synthetase